jgi:hypothetical protein
MYRMGRPFTITLSLGALHLGRLDRLARHYGVSRVEMLRRIIDSAFQVLDPDFGRVLVQQQPPA